MRDNENKCSILGCQNLTKQLLEVEKPHDGALI